MGPEGIAAATGACPICGEVFEELASYSEHLAAEHDLHDDDGAESSFGTLLLPAPTRRPAATPGDLLEGPSPRPAGPGDRGRPWGLVALVLLLALVLAGLVAFGPGPGDDDEVAEVSVEDTTTTEVAKESSTTRAPTTSAGGGTTTTVAPSGGGAPTPSSAPPTTAGASGGGSAPRPATATTTRPSTATFVAPTTSGARIDGCQRVKNQWRITYSWRFDGGTGWRAAAGYTATGGGRYQHVVDVPRTGTTLIATVQVLDQANRSHDVALRPVLSSDAC